MTAEDRFEGRRVYFDANVFIYVVNLFPPFADALRPVFAAVDAGRVSAVTSELSAAELLVNPIRDRDPGAEATCRAMLFESPRLTVAPVSRDVLIEAARMRAQTLLKLPDAIHAATALLTQCDLVLTNDHAFRAAGLSAEVVLLSEMAT